ncbi:metal-dependent hydrolase [Pontixanthobacter aquaemixtae]|uniref:Metal-dependent hydrolase n=1 Tax=Pontixanthobacter aquaemixtae TaxID=1958940 RepID=A0A844ZTW5_9SPHN|nr:metal-dependent hydrolase [Pontixanthobacter aquaemixtae]MXO90436.1 metal-dependent hydrolase [Pontixanthobacter aquaemixtae]
MDNLTHSLVGALLGQAGLKKKTGLAMPALIIGANLPDVDAACFFWLEGAEHLGFRRGITHGPPALVLLPLILAGLLYAFDRWQTKRGKRPEGRLPVNFKWLFLLSFIGCLTHPALDWLNVYGIRLLEPFSSQWFYGDTLFIIDVWLWALMGFATWFSLRREKRGGDWKKPARVAIAVSLAYIGLNGAITYKFERDGSQYVAGLDAGSSFAEMSSAEVIASPIPFDFWARETLAVNEGRWLTLIRYDSGGFHAEEIVSGRCLLPDLESDRGKDPGVDAFLFWSRAPFAERAEDGTVLLRDARFYDPRARDRFTVALPEVECEELPAG